MFNSKLFIFFLSTCLHFSVYYINSHEFLLIKDMYPNTLEI